MALAFTARSTALRPPIVPAIRRRPLLNSQDILGSRIVAVYSRRRSPRDWQFASDTINSTWISRTFEWTPQLRAAVDMALVARPLDIAPWLFCTRHGTGYFIEQTGQASGWDSMWQRFMARLLKDTKVTQRFTEHDLRGKVGSDAESLERACQLMGHADSKITKRVYRRKPEVVRPLR